jgi:tripartite-type tricarboxylate transporter receptor subunit TctC
MRMLLAVLLLAASPFAWSQAYPSKPIKLIVPFPAGSATDHIARLTGNELNAALGQPVVVENKPGAQGGIAAAEVARAAPDGYTLMMTTNTPQAANVSLFKKLNYDPVKDFTPIALMVTSWTVFAVNPNVPAQTLPELIDYAKANPGKLRYGSGGVGGVLHIAVEMLKLATGTDIVHVPYRSGAQAATDTISGQIDLVSMGLASARVAEGGKLRVLAQTGPSRHPMFSDVPTTAELGLPEVRMETWFGLAAPPNMPGPIVARLNREIATVARQSSLADKLAKIGCAVAFLPQAEFTSFLAQEAKKWQGLIPAMGIPVIE